MEPGTLREDGDRKMTHRRLKPSHWAAKRTGAAPCRHEKAAPVTERLVQQFGLSVCSMGNLPDSRLNLRYHFGNVK